MINSLKSILSTIVSLQLVILSFASALPSAFADGHTLTLPTAMAAVSGQSLDVPVTVTSLTGVAGGQVYVNYDSTVLNCTGITSDSTPVQAATVNTATSGLVSVVWEDFGNPITLTDGVNLFTIQCNVISAFGGTKALTFSEAPSDPASQLVDSNGDTITTTFTDGTLQGGADSIPVSGIASNSEGAVAWNVISGTSSFEPIKTGHSVPWTSCVNNAYYYLASRDYVDTSSTSGLSVSGSLSGFTALDTALTASSTYSASDVTVQFNYMTLGDDTEDVDGNSSLDADWSYNTNSKIETRKYCDERVY